jgi:hypothetical protein
MGVLSFFGAARRKQEPALAPAAPSYVPKPTIESPLERLEARYGASVASAADRIREAFVWHRTGRKTDAYAAFDAMLKDPYLTADAAARVELQGEIHARLRLCYEREGCFGEALVETALIYAVRVKALSASGQDSALQQMRSPEFMDRYFKPVLERARLTHASVKFRSLVEAQLKTAPLIDLNALRDSMEQLVRNPPAPPQRVVERVAGRLHIAELHGA